MKQEMRKQVTLFYFQLHPRIQTHSGINSHSNAFRESKLYKLFRWSSRKSGFQCTTLCFTSIHTWVRGWHLTRHLERTKPGCIKPICLAKTTSLYKYSQLILTDSSEAVSHTLPRYVTFHWLWERKVSLSWALVHLLLQFNDQCVYRCS